MLALIPVPIITQPTSEPYFSTNMDMVQLGGTYAANAGITSILINGTSGGVSLSGSPVSGGFWSFEAQLVDGDNVYNIIATDGTFYSSADTVTVIYNSALPTGIAVVPSGITLVQGRNVIMLNVPFPASTTDFQGFNFYGSQDPGGGTEGYTLLNTAPINVIAYAQNNNVLVSQTVTQVGNQQTTVTVENILTTDFAQFTHNRITQPLGSNPITTPNYYVITTVFFDTLNNNLVESPYSSELPGTPIVINTQLQQLTPRTQNDFLISMLNQILAADPTFDIKPGTVTRDTVVDPASTLFSNLFTILNFIHVSQSFPTLIAFDDPNGTGSSADVATTPAKAQLAQALLIPTAQFNTLQPIIDTAFDMLAGNVNKVRIQAVAAIGTITVFTTIIPTATLTVQAGAIIQTTADTVNGVQAVQFQTLSGFVVQVGALANYYNPTTNRYEFTLNIQAVVPGSSGNVNAGTITTISSGFSSGLGVINNNPTQFGSNVESNESLATRAQLAFLSVDSGTAAGYFSNTISVQGVTRAIVVGAGNPLMQRDWDPIRLIHALGKVDIYVQGTISEEITETIGFSYDQVNAEPFFVQSALLFQFRSTNPLVTEATPIFSVTEVFNVTRNAEYDLTGLTIIGDGNVIQLVPTQPLNVFIGLAATDTITVNYTFRDSTPIILAVQPVLQIVSVIGNLSGPLTAANYTLVHQDDPLLLGNSTLARDEIVFTYANGIPNGQLNNVTFEPVALLQGEPASLQLLGVVLSTIVIQNQAQTITYTLNNDYEIIPGNATTATQISLVSSGAIPNGSVVLASYTAGEQMQITYITNSLLTEVQNVINVMRHITADVLVKGAQATFINIEMTVALAIGADPTAVDQNIRNNIANQLGNAPLGRSVYQSDIVALTEQVTGVDYVVVPFTLMVKANGTEVIREELPDPVFTVYQTGTVTSYISTEALSEPTVATGAPSNLFAGAYEDDSPLTMVTSDTAVTAAAGNAYITAAGKLIVAPLNGQNPNDNVYTVTYVVEGATGSNDILLTSIEYGQISSLQITYIQTNQTFQGF